MTASSALGVLLIVDDEEMNRDMLSRRLEAEGYVAVCASDGAEALRLLPTQDFDVVLLDVMMPGQNGYEVLREIRKTRSILELPVLMVTAKSQGEDMVNAFERGANDYITKPINFQVALARINCHIASKKMSAQLKDSETRYALSAQGSNDGFWDWDFQTDRIHYSDRWKSMLGYAPDEISDSPEEWFSRIHPEDLPHAREALAAYRNGRTDQFESEYRIRHKDQTYCWVLARGTAVRDDQGRETRMAGSQTDVVRGKVADPLTGLSNRVLFMDHLNDAIKAAQSEPNYQFAALFIDLDRFKVINDSLGHQAGDELLATVARRLESSLRVADVVSRLGERCTISRFGGDEFVVLLKGINRPDDACHVADRILRVLAEPVSLNDYNVSVSASIGIALGNRETTIADDLLRDADTAMYHAKSSGKSRWSLFDQAMREQAVKRLILETELKRGLDRQEFKLYYQPIVSLATGDIEGFEALLRWQHPTRGLVSPVEFVPIAEETGLIMELGSWALEEACRQLRLLQRQERKPLFMSVNVSCKQFADPQFVDRVSKCLKQSEIDASHLKLEITETAIMSDPAAAAQTLGQLRALGIHISLDDFGTGHSSLSYLQQFPINTLKIDRSFIQRLGESREANEIVDTIVKLAHSLGMEVIAEGIEEELQQAKLYKIACEAGQGFLYSQPIPAAGIEQLLADNQLKAFIGRPSEYLPKPEAVPAWATSAV